MVSVVLLCIVELKMADGKSVKAGTRVELTDKGLLGTVAYVGTTLFSSGKIIIFI